MAQAVAAASVAGKMGVGLDLGLPSLLWAEACCVEHLLFRATDQVMELQRTQNSQS
jgi:hypothetical protein